ncbi:MAG TPA: hypothetical protein VLA13_00260 [Massilibacterium sp.]|nr:hypothetical protein [Massilibacterium sp.]
MKTGIELIKEERLRQISEEGWTPEHDDKHAFEEMAIAASCYATPEILKDYKQGVPKNWPWDKEWYKPTPENRVRELTKAGALIAAEIDRLQRLK